MRRGLLASPGYPAWLRASIIGAGARTLVMLVGIVIADVSSRPTDGLLWLLVLAPTSKVLSRRWPESPG